MRGRRGMECPVEELGFLHNAYQFPYNLISATLDYCQCVYQSESRACFVEKPTYYENLDNLQCFL